MQFPWDKKADPKKSLGVTPVIIKPKSMEEMGIKPSVSVAAVFGEDAARATISPVTVQQPPPTEGKFTVDFHVKNMQAIIDTLTTRRESLIAEGEIDEAGHVEQLAELTAAFEDRRADRNRQRAECERLLESYTGALKIAAPSGADGYGAMLTPEDAVQIKPPARKRARHPIENAK